MGSQASARITLTNASIYRLQVRAKRAAGLQVVSGRGAFGPSKTGLKEDLFQDLKPVGRSTGLVAVRDSTCLLWVRPTVMLSKLRIRAVVDLIRDGDRRAHASRYDAQLANKLAWVPPLKPSSRFLSRSDRQRPGWSAQAYTAIVCGPVCCTIALPADLAAIAAIGR